MGVAPVLQTEDPLAVTTHKIQAMRGMIVELAKRKTEALKLYEPLVIQARFHESQAIERIIRGSNQSGKTLSAAVEMARAVTRQDPFNKFRQTGTMIVVGKDGKHLGHTLWKKIFQPGAFQIIRDKVTGDWRSFRPWDLADIERQDEAIDAPPLVPERLVRWNDIAWENKRENIPSIVRLHTGWEIQFYSSLGKPPQGMQGDGGWFDEEIVDQQWYPEIAARLLKRGGMFWWSATPQAGTEQLYSLHERAEKEEYEQVGPRTIEEFVLLLDANPHISAVHKKAMADKFSEEEAIVRIGGEFALLSYKVFPEYSTATHGVEWFQIPPHWTRYVSIDPGHQVCAVLFMAVPPPGENSGDHVYLYDELYLKNADAEQLGQAMAKKAVGQDFHAFIIDHRAGRQTEIGSGMTIEAQYTAAFRRHKVKSRTTGHGFLWGADDVQAGVEASRALLRIRGTGTPRLRVLKNTIPGFDYEVRRYRNKRIGGMTTDEPETRGAVHQMANLRYLAMHRPHWVEPAKGAVGKSGAIEAFRQKQARLKEMHGGSDKYVRLGPGRKQ